MYLNIVSLLHGGLLLFLELRERPNLYLLARIQNVELKSN